SRRGVWIDQIHALRAKIGDDYLRAVWSKRKPSKPGIWRRSTGRLNRTQKMSRAKVEDIDMIDVCEIEALAFLIVEQEFVESRFAEDLFVLQVGETARQGCGAIGRARNDVHVSRASCRSYDRCALQWKRIVGIEPERRSDGTNLLDF